MTSFWGFYSRTGELPDSEEVSTQFIRRKSVFDLSEKSSVRWLEILAEAVQATGNGDLDDPVIANGVQRDREIWEPYVAELIAFLKTNQQTAWWWTEDSPDQEDRNAYHWPHFLPEPGNLAWWSEPSGTHRVCSLIPGTQIPTTEILLDTDPARSGFSVGDLINRGDYHHRNVDWTDVLKINSVADWINLVHRFPREMSGDQIPYQWRGYGPGIERWLVPDWPVVAEEIRGIWVGIGFHLEHSYQVLTDGSGALPTILTGWNPGELALFGEY